MANIYSKFLKRQKQNNKEKQNITKTPIKWLLIATICWLIIGLLLGIFYDFFFLFGGTATFNETTGQLVGQYPVFNEKIYVANPSFYNTQLSVLHVHTLVLGFLVNLILLVIEKVFVISEKRKLFTWAFWIYNIALLLVIIFMMIRGLDWIFNITYEKVSYEVTQANGSKQTLYKFEIFNTDPYKSIPASITAIPHVLIACGFALYMICLCFGINKYIKSKKLSKIQSEKAN